MDTITVETYFADEITWSLVFVGCTEFPGLSNLSGFIILGLSGLSGRPIRSVLDDFLWLWLPEA